MTGSGSPNDVSALVARYRRAVPSASGEPADRLEVVQALEAHLDDPQTQEFLLSELADPEAYDLARIEVCRILQTSAGVVALATRAGSVLVGLLQSEDDDLVRRWAAIALANYAQRADVREALLQAVADPDEDLDLRHNALASLARGSLSNSERAVLQSLADVPGFGHAVGGALGRG